jgi:glycyl-tRNA synthetase beta chain
MAQSLLLEIGVEELPASFVTAAVEALPELITKKLAELRLRHGAVHATGTPRRLALTVADVAEGQPDLDEEVLGPPARVAFDAAGKPTKAAESFAVKLGVPVESLTQVETPKGAYLAGRKQEKGSPATALLPQALAQICGGIPFRKSMRWSDGDTAFGRPVRWLVALFGGEVIPFEFAGVRSGRTTEGHRFLGGGPLELARPEDYVDGLRAKHVLVEIEERKASMVARLHDKAKEAGGALIEDAFLVEENASLVEEPQVVIGGFEQDYLALPERVILDVAKGHQRYFGVRGADGKLLPRYLAVVNTAENPANVRRGNDRVMRARLADAKFFFDEDRKTKLGERRPALDGIVFHKRLGTVGDKVRRIERLTAFLGKELGLPAATVSDACQGAVLAKCDLVTLMVGELPELQGEMGRVYALAGGVSPSVAAVIDEHYLPRGAEDETAPSDAGALVALADRLDTLVGCFSVGLVPTGTADPLALRRAAIGVLRTLLAKQWDLAFSSVLPFAYEGFAGVKLDLSAKDAEAKLVDFLAQRLRGVLSASLPADAVDACLAAGASRPYDVALRARALGAIAPEVRALAGEVFKRAANIAKDATAGDVLPPSAVQGEVPPSEARLWEAYGRLQGELAGATESGEYPRALGAIGDFAPVLGQFFSDVFVMVDDEKLRQNRLRLMRDIQRSCSRLADFNLLVRAG